jgi:hypothetical protein
MMTVFSVREGEVDIRVTMMVNLAPIIRPTQVR